LYLASAQCRRIQSGDGGRRYNGRALALTIGKMHGRETRDAVPGEAVHLYNWVINHPDCLAHLGTSVGEMTARLDALAAAAAACGRQQ
jgi:hypothetical protein